MNEAFRRLVSIVIGLSALAAGAQTTAPGTAAPWATDFDADPASMTSVGRNPYFILEPGYYIVLRDRARNQVTITVLNETRMVAGVETRVIEERELAKGKLVEISRNFFAIHKVTRDALYFGEEVSMYKNGKILSHEGSWLAGVAGARAGLMMPGQARVGYRHYQEQAPGVAMDRAEILSAGETLKTPAGTLEKCLKIEETTTLASSEREYKYYAPGIGLVKEEQMLLVERGTRHPGKPGAGK
jgi:hypothetical protein